MGERTVAEKEQTQRETETHWEAERVRDGQKGKH